MRCAYRIGIVCNVTENAIQEAFCLQDLQLDTHIAMDKEAEDKPDKVGT